MKPDVRPPVRATHERTLAIPGDADEIFALMCPVRECEWLESWAPGLVFSRSGLVEPECVFTSRDERGESIWLVTDHDPEERQLRMVKMTPEFTACLLAIRVDAADTGCRLTVRYSYTALSDAGAAFVSELDGARYDEIMGHWRAALMHYLEHGTPLPGS